MGQADEMEMEKTHSHRRQYNLQCTVCTTAQYDRYDYLSLYGICIIVYSTQTYEDSCLDQN